MDTKLRRWARRIAGANAEYDRDHVQQNALRAGSTEAAAEVAERAGAIALQTRQKIIGVVENMSWLAFTAPDTGKEYRIDLFGSGGGQEAADALSKRLGTEVPLLAQVPMDIELRKGGDEGDPIVTAHPESPAAQAIVELAKNLDSRPRGLSGMHLGVSPTNNA